MLNSIASCKKDDVNSVALGAISAKIDGSNFNSSSAVAIRNNTSLLIACAANNRAEFGIFIDTLKGLGIYDLIEDFGSYSYCTYHDSLGKGFISDNNKGNGSIIITELDLVHNTISGKFDFKGVDLYGNSILVTVGLFNKINIVNSSFKATLNDTDYVSSSISSGRNNQIDINAYIGTVANTDYPRIYLKVSSYISPGIYSFNRYDYDGYYIESPNNIDTAYYGTVTVIKHFVYANVIEGKFNFVAPTNGGNGPDLKVTNGEFFVSY